MSRLVMASSEDGATTSWRKAWAARQRRAATTMDRGAQGTNVATQDQAEPWRAAATRTERLGLGTTARTERPARLREARASTSRVKHRTSMAQERTSARRCVRLAYMKNGAGRAGEQKVGREQQGRVFLVTTIASGTAASRQEKNGAGSRGFGDGLAPVS